MRFFLFLAGVLLMIVPEFMRVYYIMPFPGSQEDVPTDLRQVNIAYWLHHNIWWIRLVGLALVIGPFVYFWRTGRWGRRIALLLPLLLAALVIYAFNFKFMADKMFYPPRVKWMAPPQIADSTANSLVIAVERNGDARAYPIELIGYHHQILDTIGGDAVMVTYCTVCRTGRAFEPIVNDQPERFRLVGMDHFNAMFEDSRTGSWWRQVNGDCVAGPLKGQRLAEVPSRQMTLNEFAMLHPDGLVFQPDSNFLERYAWTKGFDDGTIDSELEYRDSLSWQMKSWVVGVEHKGVSRAYDWNELTHHMIKDTLAGDPNMIMARGDGSFIVMPTEDFTTAGLPRSLPASQEFWHSWRTFHPNTTRYGVAN